MSNLAIKSFYSKVFRFRLALNTVIELSKSPLHARSAKGAAAQRELADAKQEVLLDLALDCDGGKALDLRDQDVLFQIGLLQGKAEAADNPVCYVALRTGCTGSKEDMGPPILHGATEADVGVAASQWGGTQYTFHRVI